MPQQEPETDPLVQQIAGLDSGIAAQIVEQEQAAVRAIAELDSGIVAQIVEQEQAAVRAIRATPSQVPRSVEMVPIQRIRARLPDVMLTPDGREDFTYILGRLVTSGVCSLNDVGDMPFPKVVRLFEYWKKTCPPAHETSARIHQTQIELKEQLGQLAKTLDSLKREHSGPEQGCGPLPLITGETATDVVLTQPGSESTAKGRKRGPKPIAHQDALKFAGIVDGVAPGGDWRDKVDDICGALEAENNFLFPGKWRKDDRSCKIWSDQPDKPKLIKAIEYRLEIARKRKKATPETFS